MMKKILILGMVVLWLAGFSYAQTVAAVGQQIFLFISIVRDTPQEEGSVRNLWSIINLVPGMMMDHEDIGGHKAAQNPQFYGYGPLFRDNIWTVDEFDITDPTAGGSVPYFMDMALFDEVQVIYKSQDPSVKFGGNRISVVIPKINDRLSGGVYLVMQDKGLQLKQQLSESMIYRGLGTTGINSLYHYGLNMGGSLIKDSVWFYGAWGGQDVDVKTIEKNSDRALLHNGMGKINFSLGRISGGFLGIYENKKKDGTNGFDTLKQEFGSHWDQYYPGLLLWDDGIKAAKIDPQTSWDLAGPGFILNSSLAGTFGKLTVNLKASYVKNELTLDPRGSHIDHRGVNIGQDMIIYSQPEMFVEGSLYYYKNKKERLNLSLDATHFLEDVLNGDHEIRFGVDFSTNDTYSQMLMPNQRILYIEDRNNTAGYKEIWWIPETLLDVSLKTLGGYISDTVTFEKLTISLGLRYDKQTLTSDDQVSPRVNLLFNVSSNGVLRLGWGHFYQSQRPYELLVQFGETEFLPAQRADQVTAGFETILGRHLTVKIDAYLRTVSDPHPRWETIFDTWHPVPEIGTDLAEIAPESVTANGLEVYLTRRNGGSFDWWLSYVYSSIEDEIDGVDTPRYLNQPHSFTASATWRPGPKWSLTGVFNYHTGWPTTAISAWPVQDPDGDWRLSYDIGPFYQEFMDDYFRIDLRASRTSRVGRNGQLTFFIDVQNLSDRENQRGIAIADPEYYYSAESGLVVTFPEEYWLPIIPSFGVSYEF